MPVISSIKGQRKKGRINVYLDGKFGFGIDLDNFVKFNLRVGQELTDEEIAKIVKEAEFQKVYDLLLRFALLRPRSQKEITNWLNRKKVHVSLHTALFNKLKRLEIVDDAKFARWWVDQRLAFKPRGKLALARELTIKGISRELVNEVLQKTEINESQLAASLLAKKLYRWQDLDSPKTREKMLSYLLRQGFSWEVAKAAIDEIAKKK